jgi:hypothetical protein
VRVYARGERIPLTIADSDPGRGTVTLIVQGVAKTTRLMNRLGPGDALLDLVGPLGKPSEVRHFGTVVVIGGGVGAAIAYPTARAMHEAGNRPPDFRSRGHSPSQAEKCLTDGNRLMSSPISLTITSAVTSATPSSSVRSTPVT